MNCPLASSNYLLLGDKSLQGGGGGRDKRSRVSVIIMVCARACSKRRQAFGFILSSLREVFASWLRVGVVEHASGSIMSGIRAFSAHLPLTSLLLLLFY